MEGHDLSGEHVASNREVWDFWAKNYVEAGRKGWADDQPRWGIYGMPESEVGLLKYFHGGDVVELGCGTAYVSAWLARRNGRPVGIDNSSAQLVVQCKTTPPVVYLFLDNTASDFHAQYTVNVFDGPDTSSDKNNGLSSTQNVAQDSLVNYAITIPIPDPGEMLTVEILTSALSTGGESITVTSEIYSQAGVNCPADFNVSLTSLPFCGAEAAGVFLNNEFSAYDAEMTVDLMVDDVLTAQAKVTVSAGEELQQVFRVEDGDSWYISWTATESTNDSTYTGQTKAQTFSPRNDGSCPEEPLFTG